MTDKAIATYRELVESSRRLEDKIDALSFEISKNYVRKDDIKDDLSSFRKDVESLKKWKFYFTGFSAAIGAIIGIMGDKFKNVFF